MFERSRLFPALAAAGALFALSSAPARANTLLGFTDVDPGAAAIASLGNLPGLAGAIYESWSQTVASSNVSVSALLEAGGVPSEGNWWITTAVGPAYTSADLIASGKYVPGLPPPGADLDFNGDPLLLLASGLHFDPGTYFLVIGAPSGDQALWIGDLAAGVAATLAPGFSVGTFGFASPPAGPGSDFSPSAIPVQLDFRLSTPAPEPAAWALLLAGFALVGAGLRRRRRLGGVVAAAALLGCTAPAAAAETLLGFTDTNPTGVAFITLAATPTDSTTVYESWTQTVAASNVSVDALLVSFGAPTTGTWWITTNVGAGFTPSDVVATGAYTAAPTALPAFDFNPLPMTHLASGMDFDPGTYFLVIGPATTNVQWIGDSSGGVTATLAPGFSPGGFGVANAPTAGPGVDFIPGTGFELDFRLSTPAPEPKLWALAIAGFGLAGAALRRRRPVTP